MKKKVELKTLTGNSFTCPACGHMKLLLDHFGIGSRVIFRCFDCGYTVLAEDVILVVLEVDQLGTRGRPTTYREIMRMDLDAQKLTNTIAKLGQTNKQLLFPNIDQWNEGFWSHNYLIRFPDSVTFAVNADCIPDALEFVCAYCLEHDLIFTVEQLD